MKRWIGVSLLPVVLTALKRRDEGASPVATPEALELALAAAPSRDLPTKFLRLSEQRMNSTHLQYIRCDPFGTPDALNDYCRHYQGEELHFTPRPLKLVLGVMAMTSQAAIHEAHRSTWMKKPGVCPLAQHKDPRCKIFPVFVFGDAGSNAHSADAVTLHDVPEPQRIWDGYQDTKGDQGWKRSWWTSQFKTPAWLAYASQHFRWATHVGKMDSDTFPDVRSIMEDLATKPVTRLGEEWPVVYGRHFMGGYNGKGGMYGEFYALSFQLVDCFLKQDAKKHPRSGIINGRNSTWGSEWWDHAEDQVLRTTLFYAEEAHVCPKILDLGVSRWKHPV